MAAQADATGPRRARRRSGTSTSAFGVGRREGHDATAFYARFEPPQISTDDAVQPNADGALDRFYVGDSRAMKPIADNSVALVVTSPPYFVGKEYEEAVTARGAIPESYVEYLGVLRDVFAECVRVLEPGGRIAVNVANLGRKPYRSLSSDVIRILQDDLHLLLRGEVVWVKARAAGGSCAWGTFRKPANPVLRDLSERVIIASKGRFDRAVKPAERVSLSLPSEATATADEFLEATTDVWEIAPESASRVGHPAPFPVELPQRLIELYTYRGDVVLDPFMGSGSTAVAAARTDRRYVGFDTDDSYVAAAVARVKAEGVPVAARGDGRGVRDVADDVLAAAGFAGIERQPKVRGLAVAFDFGANDRKGRPWLFDTVVGHTASRAGLRKTDTLWKLVGKASLAVQSTGDRPRVVLLATDVPRDRSAAATALASVSAGGDAARWRKERLPIFDVVDVNDASDCERLRRAASG